MAGAHTISAVVPFVVAAAAQKEGVDPAFVLGPLATPTPPAADEQLEVAAYFDVWKRAVERLPDPGFPLRAASHFQLEDHEVFGFLAMSCETLGQAYERTAHYRALYCAGARWELVLEPNAARLVWFPWPGEFGHPGYRAAMDFHVADMANAIERLGRDGPRPFGVRLGRPAPGDTAPFTAQYGVEPRFGAAQHELLYAPGMPERPIATFNSRLRAYFDKECSELAERVAAGNSMVAQVRKALIAAMDGGDPSVEAVARRLGVSSRSLQRKLAEEDARYNDLLNDIRAEFAKRYLSRGTVSASEVAYLVGFTEPPAFFKAFKRWTGMTPREFQLSAVT